MVTRICEVCNKEYTTSTRSKTCSDECGVIRKRDWHRRNKARLRNDPQYWDQIKAQRRVRYHARNAEKRKRINAVMKDYMRHYRARKPEGKKTDE